MRPTVANRKHADAGLHQRDVTHMWVRMCKDVSYVLACGYEGKKSKTTESLSFSSDAQKRCKHILPP